MAIKSDVWIKRMCREQGLIEPYEERLVRHVDDRRIISAGLSSYGYDCRLARDEFKVFSPVTGTEIDPKNFDPNSLLDVPLRRAADGSDYWLLPPHSYALGVTIEHFNMPRRVTAMAIGKSTYARCFRGDTRVALVDGTAPTLEEMAQRAQAGELFWGYSIGGYGRVIVTLLDAPRYVGRDALMKVELDNDEPIYCTPDHEFVRRDGRLVPAHDLRPGDALMPLYRQRSRDHEMVYEPVSGRLLPTCRLVDEWGLRKGTDANVPGTSHCHVGAGLRARPRLRGSALRRQAYLPGTVTDGGLPWQNPFLRQEQGYRNHKVLSVSELKGDHDVYCLTVPEAGNFALAAGVFVRNCGLMANTTPLEANWRGRLVVELYNAANLPVRLYAQEGFIQILFFESDEDCETSYSDRGGKYQDQQGLTLAKV